MVGQTVLWGVILVIGLPIALLLLATIQAKQGNYNLAATVIKRMPFMVDSQGMLTEEYAAYILLRSGDRELAMRYIERGAVKGVISHHYLLRMLDAVRRDNWNEAGEQLHQLKDFVATNVPDGLEFVEYLEPMVARRDRNAIESSFAIGPFGRLDDRRTHG